MYLYRMSNAIHDSVVESDNLRKMLNCIADRERLEKLERKLINFIAESFKRHEALILAYITTTNEIHEFVEMAGKDFRIGKIRQLLHKTDVQCTEIIQQFGWMLEYIDSKLTQSNGIKVAAINNYENKLLDLQMSLNQCEIHKKNRKSANLVRKIRIRISSLIEKINNTEKKMPETFVNAMNQIVTSSMHDAEDEDDEDGSDETDENVFDPEDY